MNSQITTPAPVFSTPEKLYDLVMLEEMDDNDYLLSMLSIIVTDTPADLQAITEAIPPGNYDVICTKAHALKGMAGIIQAEKFVVLLNSLEAKAKGQAAAGELHALANATTNLFNIIEMQLRIEMAKLK